MLEKHQYLNQTLDAIREMRSWEVAPVDITGVRVAANKNLPKNIQRFQTLVSLIISSQCRDEQNSDCMSRMRNAFGEITAEILSNVSQEALEDVIYPVCFYRNKARYIKATCAILMERYRIENCIKEKDVCVLSEYWWAKKLSERIQKKQRSKNMSQGDTSQGDTSQTDKSQTDKSQGDKSQTDTSQTDTSQTDKRQTESSRKRKRSPSPVFSKDEEILRSLDRFISKVGEPREKKTAAVDSFNSEGANDEIQETTRLKQELLPQSRESQQSHQESQSSSKSSVDVPETYEEICELPGVGPKMAVLLMQSAWGKSVGISVDTHVHRVSNRLGWVATKEAKQTMRDLENIIPRETWGEINYLLVGFGQMRCRAINPMCEECLALKYCPYGQRREEGRCQV